MMTSMEPHDTGPTNVQRDPLTGRLVDPDPSQRLSSGRSRFEDFEIPVAGPARLTSRSPSVTTAAVVLLVSALLNILAAVVFHPGGGATAFYLALGGVQLVAGVLVLARQPAGRWLGIALGVVGIGVGIAIVSGNAINGLITILLNGFVIYALAAFGSAFRR
jgi:hypothetical protein